MTSGMGSNMPNGIGRGMSVIMTLSIFIGCGFHGLWLENEMAAMKVVMLHGGRVSPVALCVVSYAGLASACPCREWFG
jgi:hypothetical protein